MRTNTGHSGTERAQPGTPPYNRRVPHAPRAGTAISTQHSNAAYIAVSKEGNIMSAGKTSDVLYAE